MLRDHVFKLDNIVLGRDLNAVIYAYKTGSFFINNTLAGIFPYDTIDNDIDLGSLANFKKGTSQLDVWERLSYLLALEGRSFAEKGISSVRLNLSKNEILIFSKNFRHKILRFSTLSVFDTENIDGLSIEPPDIVGYRVFDWFEVKSGMKHKIDFLLDEDEFVKKIHFYISPRIDGNKYLKDLVIESFLEKDQIADVNYSDSIARIKAINMMKSAGLKGASNGANKHLPIKLKLQKRTLLPRRESKYVQHDNVTYDLRC